MWLVHILQQDRRIFKSIPHFTWKNKHARHVVFLNVCVLFVAYLGGKSFFVSYENFGVLGEFFYVISFFQSGNNKLTAYRVVPKIRLSTEFCLSCRMFIHRSAKLLNT